MHSLVPLRGTRFEASGEVMVALGSNYVLKTQDEYCFSGDREDAINFRRVRRISSKGN